MNRSNGGAGAVQKEEVIKVRISNEPGDSALGPFAHLLTLQTEFHTRLVEETLKYLRRLQGAAAPAAPGTVLMPSAVIHLPASGSPNTTIKLKLEVENLQRVYSMVTPMLSPLVSASGVTWFPAAEIDPASLMLAPDEVSPIAIELPLPDNLPTGIYVGSLLLLGFREGAIGVTITVTGPPTTTNQRASKPARPARTARKKAARKSEGNTRTSRRQK